MVRVLGVLDQAFSPYPERYQTTFWLARRGRVYTPAVSLLRKIQEAAIDRSTDLPSLLRMCKVLASRLRNERLKGWVDAELNGYGDEASVPDYRVFPVESELTAHNPFQGTARLPIPQTVIQEILGEELAETLCKARIRQNVAEIAALVDAPGTENASMPWLHEAAMLVAPHITQWTPVKARRVIGRQRLAGILDIVRTRVLDLVLELEEEDPTLGEGDFADMSKEKGKRVEQIVQHHFHVTGNNNVINAPTTQTQYNEDVGNLDRLKDALSQLGMAPEDVEQTARVVQEEKAAKGVFERLVDLRERLGLKAAAAVEAVERFFPT